MYCKELTKKLLLKVGICKVEKIEDEWRVYRLWYDGNKKTKSIKEIKITDATRKHVYRPDKKYPKINFTARGYGTFSIPLSRFLYVWFKGDIPDGYVVDHIDNDPYNNNIDNLQILTVGDNLAKRFEDNPDAWTNQWGKSKGYNNED